MTDKQLEQYYRSLEDMFRTEGWKNLLEDLRSSAMQLNSVEACKDDKDLYFRKGQLAVMANLLHLEEQIQTAKEDYEEANKE
tara:strand:- start:2731 stop:2976 length:246 start_codon:yes stop_codon:yes gene_type:complete